MKVVICKGFIIIQIFDHQGKPLGLLGRSLKRKEVVARDNAPMAMNMNTNDREIVVTH